MNDNEIIDLYFMRSQRASAETSEKYGSYCRTVAGNILRSREDAEECVNETWLRAWNAIPPERPQSLKTYLGRITRNLCISLLRKNGSEKRGSGERAVCLDELCECLPDINGGSITADFEVKDAINRFLSELGSDSRKIFMLRYWYVFSVKEIADRLSMKEGAVKMSLTRTRKKLKEFLDTEGIVL